MHVFLNSLVFCIFKDMRLHAAGLFLFQVVFVGLQLPCLCFNERITPTTCRQIEIRTTTEGIEGGAAFQSYHISVYSVQNLGVLVLHKINDTHFADY